MNRILPALLLATVFFAAPASAHDPSGDDATLVCFYVGASAQDAGIDRLDVAACQGSPGLTCVVGPSSGASTATVLCLHLHEDKSAWVCVAEETSPGAFALGPCVESPSNLVTGPVDDYPYPWPVTCPPTRGICIG